MSKQCDDQPKPVASFVSPVHFELDTRKLVEGNHTLKIVSKDPTGKEGVCIIPFEVRNGPAIVIERIKKKCHSRWCVATDDKCIWKG